MNGEGIRVYSMADIPRYLRRGDDVGRHFILRHSDDGEFPRAFCMMFGDPEELSPHVETLGCQGLFEGYANRKGLIYTFAMTDLVEDHALRRGVIVSDTEGAIRGTEAHFRDPAYERDPAAFASRYGVDMVIAHTEPWGVMAFHHGKAVQAAYDPFEAELKEVA